MQVKIGKIIKIIMKSINRMIKRFMEDEENLSKSSQKILKSIQEKRKEAEA